MIDYSNHYIQRLLMTTWAAAFALILIGQESVEAENLDTIVVTATRIEVDALSTARSVTTSDIGVQLPHLTLTSIQEQLGQIPGLFTQNETNYAQDLRVSIRGFGARSAFGVRGVKLVVDGIPETTPDGQGQVDNLMLSEVSEIQVLRGASSSLYGNASGGVIQMSSGEILARPTLDAAIRIGAWGHRHYSLGGTLVGDIHKLRVSGSHQAWAGYRDHSAMSQTNLHARYKWDISSRTKLSWQGNYVDSPMAQDPGGVALTQVAEDPSSARDRNLLFDAGEAIQHWKTGVRVTHELAGKWTSTTYGFLSGRKFDGRLPFENSGAIDLDRIYGGLGTQITHKSVFEKSANQFSAGVDYADQSDDRERYDNLEGDRGDLRLDQNESFTNLAIFVLDHWSYQDWRIQAGVRWDWNRIAVTDQLLSNGESSGSEVLTSLNPSIGISYLLGETASVFASASTSFETPTLSEISADPRGNGFNQDLSPQRAFTIETGLRQQVRDRYTWSLSLYQTTTSDEIVSFELPDFPGRSFFRNAGMTSRLGAELSGMLKISPYFSVSGSWTQASFTYKDYIVGELDLSDNRMPVLPQQFGDVSLIYDDAHWYGRADWGYKGSFFADDQNETTVESWSLLNVQLGYRWLLSGWEVIPSLRINNLLDAFYFDNIRPNAFGSRYYEAGLPRWFQMSVTMRLIN
ncbi:MAG: TonB-dependent receptor [Bacteroidota bacterium]